MLELEARHLALDHAGIGALCAGRHAARRKVVQESPGGRGVLGGADEVDGINGNADLLDSRAKAQPSRRQAGLSGSGGHHVPPCA
jgi:hypothetical protein